MLFQQFEIEGLAQFSYAVGSDSEGKLAIVDPMRDVDRYIDYAAAHDVRITHILETHIHADYASGARELADRTGAKLLVSGYDEGETFSVQFPHRDLRDGDVVEIGEVRIKALHTPGHTPEHLSFLVYDTSRSADHPMLMLSGDFLFVGSLGRPDLLGEEAKLNLARQLFRSAHLKLQDLPDSLEIFPAHGAGSMCGAGMSGRSASSLGFERKTNPYLDPLLDEERFVAKILGSVPPFPDYYRRMKRVNSEGPSILRGLPGLRSLPPAEFRRQMESGAKVVDVRDSRYFGDAHIPGALNMGTGRRLSTWASWTLPYDTPLLLVASDEGEAAAAVRSLIRVGLDRISGYLELAMEGWTWAGYPLEKLAQMEPTDLRKKLDMGTELIVLDVRTPEEWRSGHIDGSLNVPAHEIGRRIAELGGKDVTIALVCASGYRSNLVASQLKREGFKNLINLSGGMRSWLRQGLPVTESEFSEVS